MSPDIAGVRQGAHSTPPAKISCSSLWKIYGDSPGRYFSAGLGSADTEERVRAVLEDGAIVACGDVAFEVPEAAIFVVMGLSGSGKSTVLRCLSRLVEPTFGKVLLDGENLLDATPRRMIDIRRHKMGMVFQSFGLLPHLTVLDNVAFPLKAQGMSRGRRLRRAAEMVDLVGLDGREGAYPHELSGGQQQRVGIARSLAVEPEVWFLDEPFSALDPLIRTQMQDEFLRLQRQLHKTIVFVTHDILEALRLADVICIMKDGLVVQIGSPPDIVLRPADDYVREFTGDVPLAKVLCVDAVMDKPCVTGTEHPVVGTDTLLEEAMQLFDDKTEAIDVVNEGGDTVGSLTPIQIIRALYREGEARH